MKRAWKWFIKFPMDAYAMGPIDFSPGDYDKAPGENEVREYVRWWEGVKRLPQGFECWPAS